MIKILNPEFFRFQVETRLVENSYYNLVNIFTDPRDFELPQYRKDPFASIVMEYPYDKTIKNRNYEFAFDPKYPEKGILNELYDANFEQYSMYTDDQYEVLTQHFSPDNRYHTLFFKNTENFTNKNIIIAAIPCNGIIQPISKSNNFKLYNASLIVMKNRPFQWTDQNGIEKVYDKLVYLLIDLTTVFNFHEYVFTDDTSDMDIRRITEHRIGLEYNPKNIRLTDVEYTKMVNYIPCQNRDDRKSFYEYPKKGMFYLSDIPTGIKLRRGNVVVDLNSKEE